MDAKPGFSRSPWPEAYSQVTNPGRFRPLHALALALLEQLEGEYEVTRDFAFDPLPGMTCFAHARPPVALRPARAAAAPIAVAFTSFPSLLLRLGRWLAEPFPACGCDACAETVEEEGERLTRMLDDVVSGRFREELFIPLIGQAQLRWWLGGGSSWSVFSRRQARLLGRGGRGLVQWEAWPARPSRTQA